jgi:hypothetical protein
MTTDPRTKRDQRLGGSRRSAGAAPNITWEMRWPTTTISPGLLEARDTQNLLISLAAKLDTSTYLAPPTTWWPR